MPITYRPGTLDDAHATFLIAEEAVADLAQRKRLPYAPEGGLEAHWARRRTIYEHLTRTAEHFWVAEADGELVAYARSVLRDGVRELTEFFVRPGRQAGGVGRELLRRAFPAGGARHRLIVATTDIPAQALYLRAGVTPRFPIFNFQRAPEAVSLPAGLRCVPLAQYPGAAAALDDIDRAVLGHCRPEDHAWLQTLRAGYLYMRGDRPVGYAYVADEFGPMAVLDARDMPLVLAHVEAEASARALPLVSLEVPAINRAAVDYLLARGYRIDPFFAFFMSDEPLGRFENYILHSPPFMV